MEGKIKERKGFTAIGLEYFGKNEQGEIPALWGVFNQRANEVKSIPGTNYYGVCSEMDQQGNFSYVCCVEVDSVDEIPQGMKSVVVPEGRYIVFTFEDELSKLGEFYAKIYSEGLAESGVERCGAIDFEEYDERFMKTGAFDIWIPIR